MSRKEPVVHLNLRLSPDLHQRLGEWARAEHRSLHAQVLHVVTDALDRETKRKARQSKSSQSD